ncbi:MAG: membrane dipeptidase [Deltaproteobacteria bacterium]|nr:membrane dipeptidase [Deltaproteobacteria bacterium]
MWARWLGYDLLARHRPPLPRAALGGHVDLPRLREGGVGAVFFGLVSLPLRGAARAARAVDEQIDALEAAAAARPGELVLAHAAAEVEAANRSGAVAGLLGIEGAHALGGDLDRLEHFARRGVRYLGLAHFSANEACYPAKGVGRRDDAGLTPFGAELVARCEQRGVIVDLAHVNRAGFLDACRLATRPPIVSHTGVLGAHEHWRNIDAVQLRAVADRGGCIGIMFCPAFLGGPGIDRVVAHLRHIVDVCGEEAPALGSDWDGFIVPTPELCDASRLPRLTEALLGSGLGERAVGKILRGNALRVLRDCPVPDRAGS